jgi:putative membrane protein
VLILGGHYTYARVPPGFWIQDWLDLSRNHYDRVGHFMQGFVPALVARELLLRTSPLKPGKWLFVIVTLSILGVSALYEFTEWWAALAGGVAAQDFLGTQGDVWDTQWDMFIAFCGAIVAQLTLANVHDRQLAQSGW